MTSGPGGNYEPRPRACPEKVRLDWLTCGVATDFDQTWVARTKCLACGRQGWAVYVRHEENCVTCPFCREAGESASIEVKREVDTYDGACGIIHLSKSYEVTVRPLLPEDRLGLGRVLSRVPILRTLYDKINRAMVNRASSVPGVFVEEDSPLGIVMIGGIQDPFRLRMPTERDSAISKAISAYRTCTKCEIHCNADDGYDTRLTGHNIRYDHISRDLTSTVFASGTCSECGTRCKAVCVVGRENHLRCPYCGGVNRVLA